MPTEKASTSTGQASKTKTPKKKESKDLASKVDKKSSNKLKEKKKENQLSHPEKQRKLIRSIICNITYLLVFSNLTLNHPTRQL